jgi:Fe-S cluster assembly ATPase SufC
MRAKITHPLLEIAGIAAGYHRLQVLWGVDLAIHDNESVVLLGANGAGKTTLLKAIMRLVDVWAGHIHFAGEDITGLRTDQRVRRGMVFMSESPGFPGLTIEENVMIGAQFLPRHRVRERMEELYSVFPLRRAILPIVSMDSMPELRAQFTLDFKFTLTCSIPPFYCRSTNRCSILSSKGFAWPSPVARPASD